MSEALKLHIRDVEAKNRAQAAEIRSLHEAIDWRNRQLDALNHVWHVCKCPNAVHRYDGQGSAALSQDLVDRAIKHVERLVSAWKNAEYKRQWDAVPQTLKERIVGWWMKNAKYDWNPSLEDLESEVIASALEVAKERCLPYYGPTEANCAHRAAWERAMDRMAP